MGWSWSVAFSPYGSQWRLGRRLMHEQLHLGVMPRYEGIQLQSARKLLKTLLHDSDVASIVQAFVIMSEASLPLADIHWY